MRLKTLLSLGLAAVSAVGMAADLRVGIIGCDTSHAVAFTETLNNPTSKGHVAGARVVAAYKGGSPDIPSSANRVGEYAGKLETQYGVKFYDTIEELCRAVDVVLLESVDGRPHLEQARPVIQARKPLFIDKPMAASLRDGIEIFRLAKAAGVPVFSSSSLRFATNTQAVRQGSIGRVLEAETTSPCEVEPHHPELFWYGIHGVESLYTVMGTGCKSVQRETTPDGKLKVTGIWSGGRKGTFRADKGYGGKARGEKGEAPVGSFDGYVPLVVEIVKFFQTGVAPVPPAETTELLAFMQAAELSKERGGKTVKLREVMKAARR